MTSEFSLDPSRCVPAHLSTYQGHMGWDQLMPGVLAYAEAMQHNQNNFALEGGPETTILELMAAMDLCQMVGFRFTQDNAGTKDPSPTPWGHLTGGGTVANIEAIWASRNARFHPLALREYVLECPAAQGHLIELADLEGRNRSITELSNWELVNLPLDKALALTRSGEAEEKLAERSRLEAGAFPYTLQKLGWIDFAARYFKKGRDQDVSLENPILIVPATAHLSMKKSMGLLGMGINGLRILPVDTWGRMKIDALDAELQRCLEEHRPVIAVVAVMGGTEEGSVEPLEEILDLRGIFRRRGLDFNVHVDAAWGGYHAAMIREPEDFAPFQPDAAHPSLHDSMRNRVPGDVRKLFLSYHRKGGNGLLDPGAFDFASVFVPAAHAGKPSGDSPVLWHNTWVSKQLRAMARADSVTVDPHKQGHIQYPAGGICYRNAEMRHHLFYGAPYVGPGQVHRAMGLFGVEGSRPGAAAAAVFHTHRLLRPHRNGYGQILGREMFNAKYLFVRMHFLAAPEDPFLLVHQAPLPQSLPGGVREPGIKLRLGAISRKSPQELAEEDLEILRAVGPDLNVLAYSFNFLDPDTGMLNRDLGRANAFNAFLYEKKFGLTQDLKVVPRPLYLSQTEFREKIYGSEFMDGFCRRLGLATGPGWGQNTRSLTALRSVIMDPLLDPIGGEPFFDYFIRTMRNEVREGLEGFLAARAGGDSRGQS